MCIIRVGGERSEFLALTLLGRSHADARDYWDGNWVRVSVEVIAGGFRGEVGGDLRAEELASFHGEITRLAESVVGEARFTTMEDWLSIVLAGDRRGGVELSCEVRDQPGIGNALARSSWRLDQTYLRPIGRAARARAVAEFPHDRSPGRLKMRSNGPACGGPLISAARTPESFARDHGKSHLSWLIILVLDPQALGLLAMSVGLLKVTFARFRTRSPAGAGQRPTLTVAAAMLLVAWAGVILANVQWFQVNFATVYAPSYREDGFAQVRIGMTRQEVEPLLGPPLRNSPLPSEFWEPDDCWVYSRPPGPGLWGDNYWRRWIFFGPGKEGRVDAIVKDYYED